MLRNNKGITLIALIITVIVLLILAAVSIDLVVGDGLFDKAGNAVSKTNSKIGQHQTTMNELIGIWDEMESSGSFTGGEGTETGGQGTGTGNNPAGGGQTGGETGGNTGGGETGGNQPVTPTVVAGNKATENSRYTSNGKTAVIPGGFTVSGVPSESTIDGGLVIYLIDDKTEAQIAAINWNDSTTVDNMQRTYDQFVWIPVDDINDMYMCQNEDGTKSCRITVEAGVAKCTTHNSTQMAGRLYSTITGENFNSTLTTQIYTANSGLREPDVVTDYDGNSSYLNQLTNILGTGYITIDNFKQSLQIEYNEIVKSVYENKGFYVGRYETSNITTTDGTAIQVIAGVIPGNETWYCIYAQQKDYAKNKNLTTVGSTMIQGAAYDQVMKFVETDENYNPYSAGEISHSYSSAYITGLQSGDFAKNIYDLEGNVLVWTTEAYRYDYRVFRGGAYGSSRSASCRVNGNPSVIFRFA